MLTTPPDARLADHLWIGGSPCSGKSTVAVAVAAAAPDHLLYSCDDAWDRHVLEPTADQPTLHELAAVPDATRLRRPVSVQVADVVNAYREQFSSILADVESSGPSILEGAALMPELLAGLGVRSDRAIWMVPTEEFQRAHYARRTWAFDLLAGEPDAADLFEAWMRRDAEFATIVAQQARTHGFPLIVVDGARSTADTTARVLRHFGLED